MIDDKDYLQQKQEWVKYRLDKLDQVEEKLIEMRKLAEYARESILCSQEIKELNVKVNKLQQEVIAMDEHSRRFWLDYQ